MSDSRTELFVHLVWGTWDRRPVITPELMTILERSARAEAHLLGAEVKAFGGIEDHIHLVARFPSTLPISSLVKQVKGSTSHLLHKELHHDFKWQGGYGGFTVDPVGVERAMSYVRDQPAHHRSNTFIERLERTR